MPNGKIYARSARTLHITPSRITHYRADV